MSILSAGTGNSERPGPGDIWRTWLVTGARAHPIDRRRLQGRHRGLKQILAEGGESDALRRPWRDFSRAMARQSVNEAMGRLTARERVVLTMAYFAGFSNLEIADQLGMTGRGVQRSLRRALDRLSDALENGRRIALGFVLAITCGRFARWLSDATTPASTHAVAVAILTAAVVAAPVVGASSDRPAPATFSRAAVDAAVAQPAAAPSAASGGPSTTQSAPAPPAVNAPVVTAPSLTLPALPSTPPVPKVKLPKLPL